MKKRKIRYDRILLPILILCVIIFGISSCHKTEETKVQSKPIHTTTDFLKNALKPVGQTLYIYGGGWNEAQTGSGTEALTLGLSKEYKSILNSDALSSDKYWALRKKIYEDYKSPGVLARDVSRSNMFIILLGLLRDEAITMDDLDEFSDELKEDIKQYMK